ncbi:NRPS-independent siderophore synthetase rfs [Psilocybe cubensis]|uniref:NRPS-independent siderophore synthetase rfs n=2 Tax=Psilocybe cubensis TaxID=181762 RepID=A0ACB8H0W2_PSICU|nr:NRPS-independent siderophore synthetase rfs [Psilocybe cubensis]KAH9481479.1 NRPS-independent siderophore synthetase rfs [Psilocybe cubensis]
MSSEPPRDRASFAVMSRLISCLVTEQILRAFYVPMKKPTHEVAGLLVVLSTHTISEDFKVSRTFHTRDIFVIVQLNHKPVLKDVQIHRGSQLVGLVDPMDMISPIYEFQDDRNVNDNDIFVESVLESLSSPPWDIETCGSLYLVSDPVALWKKFVETVIIADELRDIIALELQSSLDWQTISYENPPLCPSLQSASIDWEQSLVAGHPTHPMHRARMFLNNDESSLEYDWYHPHVRFVRVPARSLDVLGQFRDISNAMVTKAATKAGRSILIDNDYIYMPVHELQIINITSKFKDVDVLDEDIFLPALAQSSIRRTNRTVVIPDFPAIALKLAVGVKISSSLRTISHFTANFGPRFSEEIVPKLAVNPAILAVELESSSAVYRCDDPELSKHFTAVIRDEYKPREGETVIVCAALLEAGHANVPTGISAVQHTFQLDTEEKRASFLDRYIRIACEALLPALVKNGVAFEAHAQNILARFDLETGQLQGFIFRDLGGLRIHPETLRNSTGVDFQFLPGHCVATKSLEEIYPKFYHTFVHNHIQRLSRLLGLHHNGRGYEMLRKHMGSVIPENHPVWKVWMDPTSTTVDSKCLMRMRMRDSYRDMVYSPYPNMIQYRPTPEVSTADKSYWSITKLLVDYMSFIRASLFGGK